MVRCLQFGCLQFGEFLYALCRMRLKRCDGDTALDECVLLECHEHLHYLSEGGTSAAMKVVSLRRNLILLLASAGLVRGLKEPDDLIGVDQDGDGDAGESQQARDIQPRRPGSIAQQEDG